MFFVLFMLHPVYYRYTSRNVVNTYNVSKKLPTCHITGTQCIQFSLTTIICNSYPTQDFSDHPVPLHVLFLHSVLSISNNLEVELAVAAGVVGKLVQQVGYIACKVLVARRIVFLCYYVWWLLCT